MADLTDYEIEQLEFRVSEGRTGSDFDDVRALIAEVKRRRSDEERNLAVLEWARMACLRHQTVLSRRAESLQDLAVKMIDRLILSARSK